MAYRLGLDLALALPFVAIIFFAILSRPAKRRLIRKLMK